MISNCCKYGFSKALLLLFSALCFHIEADAQDNDSPRFNYGIKGGFVSTDMYVENMLVDGCEVTRYSRDSQVSTFISGFGRLNLGRFYLQTECTLQNIRSAINFEYYKGDDLKSGSFAIKGTDILVPVLLGYNFRKESFYTMSVFAGPKLYLPIEDRYTASYSLFPDGIALENLEKCATYLTMGLGCSIRNLFFDFEYNIGLQHLTDGALQDPASELDTRADNFIERRLGTFSFSIGIFL